MTADGAADLGGGEERDDGVDQGEHQRGVRYAPLLFSMVEMTTSPIGVNRMDDSIEIVIAACWSRKATAQPSAM